MCLKNVRGPKERAADLRKMLVQIMERHIEKKLTPSTQHRPAPSARATRGATRRGPARRKAPRRRSLAPSPQPVDRRSLDRGDHVFDDLLGRLGGVARCDQDPVRQHRPRECLNVGRYDEGPAIQRRRDPPGAQQSRSRPAGSRRGEARSPRGCARRSPRCSR